MENEVNRTDRFFAQIKDMVKRDGGVLVTLDVDLSHDKEMLDLKKKIEDHYPDDNNSDIISHLVITPISDLSSKHFEYICKEKEKKFIFLVSDEPRVNNLVNVYLDNMKQEGCDISDILENSIFETFPPITKRFQDMPVEGYDVFDEDLHTKRKAWESPYGPKQRRKIKY